MTTLSELTEVISRFLGPRTLAEQNSLPGEFSITAENVQYKYNSVGCRPGLTTILSTGAITRFFYSWNTGAFNRFLFINSSNLNVNSQTPVFGFSTLETLITYTKLSVASFGSRLFIAKVAAAVGTQKLAIGVGNAKVLNIDPATPATYQFDDLWPTAPPAIWAAPVVTTPASINAAVTPGTHQVGLLITTRSGYVVPPIFPPAWTPFNVPAGTYFTLTFNIPAGINAQFSNLQLIMAPVDAPSEFYVIPQSNNSFFITPAGTVGAVLIVNTSDTQLRSGTDTSTYANNFVQGTPFTFNPYVCRAISDGSRMAYIGLIPNNSYSSATESALFVSDSNLPQTFGVARSIIQLPGAAYITTVVSMRSSVYLFSAQGKTYGTSDNGGDPSTWPKPVLVDGTIGAIYDSCVFEDVDQGILWVAHPSGLYIFSGGAYTDLAVTYYLKEWSTINWNLGPGTVKVSHDPVSQRVFVMAPFGTGATFPNKVLVIDHALGRTAETVRFSFWRIMTGPNTFDPEIGDITVYHDPYSLQSMPAFAGAANIYVQPQKLPIFVAEGNDIFTPVAWEYETVPLTGDGNTETEKSFTSIFVSASTIAGGTITPSVCNADASQGYNDLLPITSAEAPTQPAGPVWRAPENPVIGNGMRVRFKGQGAGWITRLKIGFGFFGEKRD